MWAPSWVDRLNHTVVERIMLTCIVILVVLLNVGNVDKLADYLPAVSPLPPAVISAQALVPVRVS